MMMVVVDVVAGWRRAAGAGVINEPLPLRAAAAAAVAAA